MYVCMQEAAKQGLCALSKCNQSCVAWVPTQGTFRRYAITIQAPGPTLACRCLQPSRAGMISETGFAALQHACRVPGTLGQGHVRQSNWQYDQQ